MAITKAHPYDFYRNKHVVATFPRVAIPDLEVYLTGKAQVPWAASPSGSVKITCVAHHVGLDGQNKVRIFLSEATTAGQAASTIDSGGEPIYRKAKGFRHFYGPVGAARGIADYVWADTTFKKNSTRATAVMVHELGHVLHQVHQPDAFWAVNCAPNDFTQAPNVRKNVSTYGASCLIEFVAEVFTARVLHSDQP